MSTPNLALAGSGLLWKVYDLGAGQIVARCTTESWPLKWPLMPEIPTWEGEARSAPEAIDLAAVYCYVHELPWSGSGRLDS